MKNLHPYALIIGIGIGIMVQFTLRYPPFALFAAIVAVISLDMGIKYFGNKDSDKS
jgi:hypothetical protein